MYKVPHLQDCKNAQEFFRKLYEINQPKLSHRKFAGELNWPVSYLGDVIQGRKKLTVNRAIQLATALQLNAFQHEYLLMLALQEVDSAGVRNYAQSFLSTEGTPLGNDPLVENSKYIFTENADHFHERSYLSYYLQRSQGQLDLEDLREMFPAIPLFAEKEWVLDLLMKMKADGQVDGHIPPIKVLQPHLMRVNGSTETWLEELDILRQVWQLTSDDISPSSGGLLFPVSKMLELRDRRNALVSWVLRTSEQHPVTSESKKEDHTILHMMFSVFEILKADKGSPHSVYNFDKRPDSVGKSTAPSLPKDRLLAEC